MAKEKENKLKGIKYTVLADTNIRSTPQITEDNKIGELKKSEKITVYSIDGAGWANIGDDKYCSTNYITEVV